MILYCGCSEDPRGDKTGASYQDAKYGEGMRVHTSTKSGETESARKYRCRVCNHERTQGESRESSKKKSGSKDFRKKAS